MHNSQNRALYRLNHTLAAYLKAFKYTYFYSLPCLTLIVRVVGVLASSILTKQLSGVLYL